MVYEDFEDIKGIIRIPNSKKDRQQNDRRKGTKEQTMVYETLYLKSKIE